MALCIRSGDDYWSDALGWTRSKYDASYFDKPDDVWPFVLADFADLKPYVEEVPNHIAGLYALKYLIDDYDDHDKWGWAMSWLLAICDHLTFDRSIDVPSDWCFVPSPLGKSEYAEGTGCPLPLCDMSDYQILYVGRVLHRYTEILRKAGKDY